MAKILIVDDEPDIRALVRRYAEREGYETAEAGNGMEAVSMCREADFDVIIMDAMMPELDGFSACKEIRAVKDIPVIMLSARGEEYDKLFGFETGADDYVVKPFSPRELMARVKVVTARHGGVSSDKSDKIKAGNIEIDTLGRIVYINGEKTELTAKEYDLLLYLMKNEGVVLTRDRIMDAVWGYDYYSADRTVDWQIKQLRAHLGDCRDYIVTVRGVGYKFEARH